VSALSGACIILSMTALMPLAAVTARSQSSIEEEEEEDLFAK